MIDHLDASPDFEMSFRGDAKRRTRNLEIPDMVLRTIPE